MNSGIFFHKKLILDFLPLLVLSLIFMEEIILKNGVTMQVEDKTAVLTGDLYMVHLEFTTMVNLGEGDTELRRYCKGEKLKFTRAFKKPAVHKRDLEEVKSSMKDSFLSTNLPYLEHPEFVSRFKAKMLKDFQDEEEKERRRANG